MQTRLDKCSHLATLGMVALLALAGMPPPAQAQASCDADAASCDDDAGASGPGSGPVPMSSDDGGLSPAGMDGGSEGDGGAHAACSCETDQNDDGQIHVCTDSFEADVCASFSCELGTVRSRGCPTSSVRLCCEMPARGLQSRLYDDCTHPNCESGFREQCGAFGGDVHEGDCERSVDDSGDGSDGGGGLCAVARPGGDARASWLGWALACCGLGLRRRMR